MLILGHIPKLLVTFLQHRSPGERKPTPHCWSTNFMLSYRLLIFKHSLFKNMYLLLLAQFSVLHAFLSVLL